jgi:hypothetical protein
MSEAGVFPVPEYFGANVWRNPVGTGTFYEWLFQDGSTNNGILRFRSGLKIPGDNQVIYFEFLPVTGYPEFYPSRDTIHPARCAAIHN